MSTDTSDAEAICNALDTTLEAVDHAGEWVDAWTTLVDDGEPVCTTETFGDVDVHMHQLVRDPEGHHFVVVHLGAHFIQVARLEDWTRFTFTEAEIVDGLVEPVVASNGTPVFGY